MSTISKQPIPAPAPLRIAGVDARGQATTAQVAGWLAIADIAKMLKCSRRWVELKISAGELPAMKDGRVVRIRSVDLEAFVAKRMTGGPP